MIKETQEVSDNLQDCLARNAASSESKDTKLRAAFKVATKVAGDLWQLSHCPGLNHGPQLRSWGLDGRLEYLVLKELPGYESGSGKCRTFLEALYTGKRMATYFLLGPTEDYVIAEIRVWDEKNGQMCAARITVWDSYIGDVELIPSK